METQTAVAEIKCLCQMLKNLVSSWLDSHGEGNMSREDDLNKHLMSSEAERWQPDHCTSSVQALQHGQRERSPTDKPQSEDWNNSKGLRC